MRNPVACLDVVKRLTMDHLCMPSHNGRAFFPEEWPQEIREKKFCLNVQPEGVVAVDVYDVLRHVSVKNVAYMMSRKIEELFLSEANILAFMESHSAYLPQPDAGLLFVGARDITRPMEGYRVLRMTQCGSTYSTRSIEDKAEHVVHHGDRLVLPWCDTAQVA